MNEPLRRSASPMIATKYSKMFLNEIEKISSIVEDPIDESEETLEIASQLALIRKRYDKTKEANNKKRLYFEKLQSDMEKNRNSAAQADQEIKILQSKIEDLRISLDQSKKKHELELLNKCSYLHVLDRMKEDKVAMEIQSNSLQMSLKSTRTVLNLETDKFRKVRESQFQSKVALQEIKHAIASDYKRKNEKLSQLEKNMKERQEIASRREERQRRQVEISEAAAIDGKDSYEIKIRENLLTNRMWYMFLRKKIEAEIAKGGEIEQAFQQIKAATGMSDINEIVEKFLTKETSYKSLVGAVDEAEKKLEALKEYNLRARSKLNKAQFDDGGNNRKIYTDIEGTEIQLGEYYKEFAMIKEKLNKEIISYDQVLNWGLKIFNTLEIKESLSISPGSKVMDSKDSLERMFVIIYNKMQDITGPLQNKKEETRQVLEDFARKTTGEIVNEISTHDEISLQSKNRNESHSESDKISESLSSCKGKTPKKGE